jgi:hypothetical protein
MKYSMGTTASDLIEHDEIKNSIRRNQPTRSHPDAPSP